MTTKEPLALEYDTITPAYADQLTRIERHGPVSHLIFCPFPKSGLEWQDAARCHCRLPRYRPTEMLARMARQLGAPAPTPLDLEITDDADTPAARH
jgi:hypothetical protein